MPSKTKKPCVIELVQFTVTGQYVLEIFPNMAASVGRPLHSIPLLEYEAKELAGKLKIEIQRRKVY